MQELEIEVGTFPCFQTGFCTWNSHLYHGLSRRACSCGILEPEKSLLLWDIGTHPDTDALCAVRHPAHLRSIHVSRLYLQVLTRILAAEWMAKDKKHSFSLKRKEKKNTVFEA